MRTKAILLAAAALLACYLALDQVPEAYAYKTARVLVNGRAAVGSGTKLIGCSVSPTGTQTITVPKGNGSDVTTTWTVTCFNNTSVSLTVNLNATAVTTPGGNSSPQMSWDATTRTANANGAATFTFTVVTSKNNTKGTYYLDVAPSGASSGSAVTYTGPSSRIQFQLV